MHTVLQPDWAHTQQQPCYSLNLARPPLPALCPPGLQRRPGLLLEAGGAALRNAASKHPPVPRPSFHVARLCAQPQQDVAQVRHLGWQQASHLLQLVAAGTRGGVCPALQRRYCPHCYLVRPGCSSLRPGMRGSGCLQPPLHHAAPLELRRCILYHSEGVWRQQRSGGYRQPGRQ